MPTINLGRRKKQEYTRNKRDYQHIYQDRRWKDIVITKNWQNPICEECERVGKVTETEEIHHIIPFQKGKTPLEIEELAFNIDNTMSLCIPCHHKKHHALRYRN